MMSAAELGEAYRAGRLSPVDALRSVLLRLEEVNPALNAVVTVAGEEAFECALQSARRWQDGGPLSPLDGVPFTVKDNIPTAGMRSTFGSRLLADHVPRRDELPIARLRSAGAILLGKTNVPEFALHGATRNAVFGTTRNPWDASRTPGGSSGGAVAALAAGIAPLAIATDGGGSIRRPCAHTGVTGLKPSTGRVPRTHGFPAFLHDFEVIGPIARSVSDLALAMQIIAAPDAGDARSAGFLQRPFELPYRLSRTRIRVLTALGGAPVDGETREQVVHAARVFSALGHEVVPDGEDGLDDVVDAMVAVNTQAWPTISQAGLAWLIEHCYPGREADLTPEVAALLTAGRALPASAYQHALHLVQRLRDRLTTLFAQVDYLLLPAAAAQPWSAEHMYPAQIDGIEVGPRGHAIFTAFANAAGLPALALPAGMSSAGLPIGLQLVGRHGADAELCALGCSYEQAAPWPQLFSAASLAQENRFGSGSNTPNPPTPQLACNPLRGNT
jgi:aspartyl-tRNA(Asn)/glutamyl-tRNA(Gln) amidotransferase subunit A